jgi:N-acetylmuramoyl-L-alanine amidase
MHARIRAVALLTGIALVIVAGFVVRAARTGRLSADIVPEASDAVTGAATAGGIHVDLPTLTVPAPATPDPATPPTPVPTVDPRRVGIIAGHWLYDTGAVCPDGREEVEVTTDVALRVQAILNVRGLAVDVLPEHDPDRPGPPLQGYRAAALVSIHADSCDVPGVSGFKVARWLYSTSPAVDDRLVACLYREYGAATSLGRHDDSISVDMWNYYAFREIAVETPAAIIELGFLLEDRATLDDKRYEMALGVADGISCFLGGRDRDVPAARHLPTVKPRIVAGR